VMTAGTVRHELKVQSVDVSAAKELIDAGALVVDVRPRDRYGSRHIPGAIPVPIDELETGIPEAIRDVPKDRAIDGVNQLPFLEGKQPKSNRDHVLFYTNQQLRAVKWQDWKFHYVYQPEAGAPAVAPLMRLFNLLSDPREESDIKDVNPWAQSVMDRLVATFVATTERYPHVPPNTPDPYVPPKKERGQRAPRTTGTSCGTPSAPRSSARRARRFASSPPPAMLATRATASA